MDAKEIRVKDECGGFMKKVSAIIATMVLATTLGLAQGTANQSASDDNNNRASAPPTARNYDVSPRSHDIGWIGLLGLLGLAGLRRRSSDVAERNERETRGADMRRVA